MLEVILNGCAPEPLMSYLKALGVFRLVAEQIDPNARLSWHGGVASLHSKLDGPLLVEAILRDYKPTPIVAPWNAGSGFYDGGEPLARIAASTSARLVLYRDTIDRIRAFVPKTKPKDDVKDALLTQCRSELSDAVMPWLDVCFVLGEKGPSFFPLLGTGGNDGRLEFTNNFMQRLADVVPFEDGGNSPKESNNWLRAALFADTLVELKKSAIGQFNPGGLGGANSVQGSFEAGSRVNPWDFVLMIEGALLFAGSLARRLGANSSLRAVFPFSVESIAVGYGSATTCEETTDGSRAELWLPLWNSAFSLAEVQYLFAEGRAQFGRRQAKNAVEFALAVNLLGVNRGVKSFARYGFLKRNGLAFLATPLGRVEVQHRPDARLLEDPPLVNWIDRLRRACSDKDRTPARYLTALRGIDRAMYAFANRSGLGNGAGPLLDVLVALGRAEQTMANGLRFCKEKSIRPLQGLSTQWLEQANDDSPEFRLAIALAGIRGEHAGIGPFRAFLEEVKVTKFVNWFPGSTSAVWSNRSLTSNLAGVFCRRQMEAYRVGLAGVPLYSPRPAGLAHVIALLNGEIDDDKLAGLLWALPALDWSPISFELPPKPDRNDFRIPFEFGVARLLVKSLPLVANGDRWSFGETSEPTKPDPDVFNLIASGQKNPIELGIHRAALRLESGGRLVNGYRNRRQSGRPLDLLPTVPTERLLAGMLVPLSNQDLELIANNVLYPPESED